MLRKKQKGFTLIELLVVIAIIGVLATIVLVSLNTARQKARDARRESDMHQFSLAMEMYYDSNGSQYFQSTGVPTALGTFMPAVPSDPGSNTYSWGSNAASNQKYMMCATLENGGYIYASSAGTKLVSAGTCASAALAAQ